MLAHSSPTRDPYYKPKMGQPELAFFCFLHSFSNNLRQKYVLGLQQDSNFDCRRRRQDRWPLDLHLGSIQDWTFRECLLVDSFEKLEKLAQFQHQSCAPYTDVFSDIYSCSCTKWIAITYVLRNNTTPNKILPSLPVWLIKPSVANLITFYECKLRS